MFLRCLLLVVLPLGLNLSSSRPADETKAATAIEKLGGLIKRDETLPQKPVIEVDFQGSTTGRKIKDADLVVLRDLKHLKVLYLGYVTETTDAGMVYLKDLKSLQKLALPDTRITDAGLAYLRNLTNLQSLGLAFCKGVTDKGLVYLRGMKQLKDLNIAGTQITEKGIADLKRFLPGVYITGGLRLPPTTTPGERARTLRAQYGADVSADMIDFMSLLDGTEKGSEATVKKYVVPGPGVFNLSGIRLESPRILRTEKSSGRVIYMVQFKQGLGKGIYRIGWQRKKITEIKQVSLTFD